MPDIASVLKEEIRRLARKEARAELTALKEASSRYRRDIAALKRENAALMRSVSRLERAVASARHAKPKSGADASIRFSPDWVAKHREKLGMSAADYADLVGVSMLTIYNWEKGKSRPRREQLEAWAAVRSLGKREAWRRLETAVE